MLEAKAWFTLARLLSLLVLIAVFVLWLTGRLPGSLAYLFAALALAQLLS